MLTIIKPGTTFNFIGEFRRFGTMSIVLCALSLVMLVVNVFIRGSALNYGIDFRGGTQVQIDFQDQQGIDTAAVRKAMSDLGYKRVSVIKAGTSGNAYVLRMENPSAVDPAKGKALEAELQKRFLRTVVHVELPAAAQEKAPELLAAIQKAGVTGLTDTAAEETPGKPVFRFLADRVLAADVQSKVEAALKDPFKGTVRFERSQLLRRFRPASSGDHVRLMFAEEVKVEDIREAFIASKVEIAAGAGAFARHGRQEKGKIRWQVRLQGLAEKITDEFNQKLSRFVKGTGALQSWSFAPNLPLKDDAVRDALQKAGFQPGAPHVLRVTFTLTEKRAPGTVGQGLTTAGLKLAAPLTEKNRVGNPDNLRWFADLRLDKQTPVAELEAAVKKAEAKLESVGVRLTEDRYRQVVTAAGFKDEDALVLRVVFNLDRAKNAREVREALREAKIPLAAHQDTIAQVGSAEEMAWLVVLDVKGKQSGLEIEQKLASIGSVGISGVEIPPHGAVKSIQSVVRVGSKVGKKLRVDGILSVLYTLGLILVYIALRFDLKFAPGAIVALFHDVTITLGLWAVFWLEFNLATIAALLTIVGYSINDTIVVYDRIRETISRQRDVPLDRCINIAVNDTLSRTVLTSLTTALAILPILFLGSGDTYIFALAMMIGIVIGTYSSIFIASPMSLVMERWMASRPAAVAASSGGGGDGGAGGSRTRRPYERREKKQREPGMGDAEARS
jgi:preprotein translocase SecF subunit